MSDHWWQPFAPPTEILVLLAFFTLFAILRRLFVRDKRGKLLLRVTEQPAPARQAADVVLKFLSHRPSTLPHPGLESFTLFENGVEYSDGTERRFVLWMEIDSVEWRPECIVLNFQHAMFLGSDRTHALDIPENLRSEVDTIIRTHIDGLDCGTQPERI